MQKKSDTKLEDKWQELIERFWNGPKIIGVKQSYKDRGSHISIVKQASSASTCGWIHSSPQSAHSSKQTLKSQNLNQTKTWGWEQMLLEPKYYCEHAPHMPPATTAPRGDTYVPHVAVRERQRQVGAGVDPKVRFSPRAEGPVLGGWATQGPVNHRSGACGLPRCYGSESIGRSRVGRLGKTSADCCTPEWVVLDRHRLQAAAIAGHRWPLPQLMARATWPPFRHQWTLVANAYSCSWCTTSLRGTGA